MELRFVGGINQRQDTDIHPWECTAGANFRIDHKTLGFLPRLPQTRMGKAPAAATVWGIMQLIKRDGTQTQLVVSGSTVYEWNLSTTFTSRGTVAAGRLRGVPWLLDDLLLIVDRDKNNDLLQWNGTALTTMTTGLTNLQARYGVVHNGRFWLFNCQEGSTDYEHVIMASEFENQNNFNITNQGTAQSPATTFADASAPFFIVAPNLKPINGACLHLGSLIISTVDGRLFRLTGESADDYNFIDYYAGSAATGEAGAETMASIGNDISFVRKGPAIELLSTTERFGDTATDDLSVWIPEEMDIDEVKDAIVSYDQRNQQVYFFVNGNNGRVLVLDKSKLGGQVSPWGKYTTDMTNNFNTVAVEYLRDANGQYHTYWGDFEGHLFRFRGNLGTEDDGVAIPVTRSTKVFEGQQLPAMPLYGEIQYKRAGIGAQVDIDIDFEPERYVANVSVALAPLEAPQVGSAFSRERFTPPGSGDRLQFHFQLTGANWMQVDKVVLA